MDNFLPVLSLLLLSVAVSHASLPAQIYWQSVLPNTPMPNAIRDLLRPDVLVDEKSGTAVNVGKGGVNVNTGYKKPSGGTNVNVGNGGVNVHTGYKKPGGGTSVNVGHGGVNFGTGHKGEPFIYNYAATETQIHDDPRVTLFFLEKDLHAGAKKTLHFTRSSGATTFLPRRVADSLPFSSDKMPEIVSRFSIEPNSEKAEAMRKTTKVCEEPAAEGEQKVCATSLESMVDFSTASLGTRDLRAESSTAGKGAEVEQEYTVAPAGVQKWPDRSSWHATWSPIPMLCSSAIRRRRRLLTVWKWLERMERR